MSEQMVYRVEDWPHGLRCAKCEKEFTEGQPINEDLTMFIDGTPVLELTCYPCAVKGDSDQEVVR